MIPGSSRQASSFAAAEAGATGDYQPGRCNIGPAEIARRRRSGHIGALITIGLLVALLILGASPAFRLLVALPAAISASGYLQAILHFCAGFGARGIFNFGPLGQTTAVADPADLARDRTRSRQISLASLLIGLAVGLIAALAPL